MSTADQISEAHSKIAALQMANDALRSEVARLKPPLRITFEVFLAEVLKAKWKLDQTGPFVSEESDAAQADFEAAKEKLIRLATREVDCE